MSSRRRFLQYGSWTAASLAVGAGCHGGETPIQRGETQAQQRPDNQPDYKSTGVELRTSTPKQDGFYFPAEWQPHAATIMAFPPAQNWQGYGLSNARQEWADTANTISEFEPVMMAIDPADTKIAQQLLSRKIELLEYPLNDGWSRDSGPMILVNGQGDRRVAGFTFNGWGEKLPPYADDAMLKAHLAKQLDLTMYPIPLVMEGGGVILDGEGTVITTEQCLLHPNRNPGISKVQVEQYFADYLGATKTIWLGQGLTPDPITDGHVDGIAAYAAPGVVLLHTTDDPSDPNYAICRDAQQRLSGAKDAKGRKLKIITMPLGEKALHMGFYIANGCVVVPIANDPAEDDAPLAILRETFGDRQVIGVSGVTLAQGGGSVHCITQQVPHQAKAAR
ncbi:agmatine deiminase family protein [filamentous cyanobacterium LEGE 11480]|uniref:Agmatine deiminase family protein n=1 Tax=Romeriopsis navalis LEGE 11480 TaxID=2777977 RepID=A0A928Z456_9CYAN|nr:agmatine deiminase family protein [Romeriopsis navalis]MBE9032221.1 agmatine deiminase family protein [Romeriopsis navalis LEGE 11480]